MSKGSALILVLTILNFSALGQDSLPGITVKNRSGKVILSWANPFSDIVLINIQRSPDSLKGFKTILAVADPKAVTNGFLDSKAPNTNQYYRLYVQQEGGKYFFTPSYKPYLDTARPKPKTSPVAKAVTSAPAPAHETPAEPVAPAESTEMERGDMGANKKIEKNSVARKKLSNTKPVGVGDVEADAPEAQEFRAPSVHVYTTPQGNVVMALPPEKTNIYTLKFYKEDGTHLFTMNKVKDHQLTLDKTNFIRSGWFRFELYENNVMKEKNRFFIPRENF
ncbi:MAG TPA: hypothetical protein VLA58_06630 [Chitinophagaceae bacterium]|nr:hypothetical protein [Chitinophagaceae bacterium]